MSKKIIILLVAVSIFFSNYSLINAKKEEDPTFLIKNFFPDLEIERISGGFGVKASIKNNGDLDVHDIKWNISICGGNRIINRMKSGKFSNLPSGESRKIRMFPFGIGFGRFTKLPEVIVTVKIDETSEISEKITAKIIGPISILIENDFPRARFTYSPRDIIVDEEIKFTDFSEDHDGEIVTWSWDFGNEDTIKEKNPIYHYEKSGVYPVTLTVIDDQGATDSCTRVLGVYTSQEPNEDCNYPVCCINPRIYDSNGSNDPSNFLGDRILTEIYSDWKNYTPLVEKVNNLISGLTNDYDKLLAIASYVKNSKKYGVPGDSCFNSTVIDIYHYEKGVCMDSSILLSAMLRLAGIPAKSVGSVTVSHVFNDVYINNTWLLVDATFDWEVPIIVNDLSNIYYPNIYNEYIGTYHNVTYKDSDREELLEPVYLFKSVFPSSKIIKHNYGEGIVISPIVSYPVYYNSNDNSEVFIEKTDYYTDLTDFYHTWYDVLDDFGKANGSYKSIKRCSYVFSAPAQHFANPTKYTGYCKTFLPAFRYRAYFMLNGDNIAYYDFEIKDGQTTIIKPEDIKKCSEANQNDYNVLMCLIDRLPSYDELI